MLEDMFPGSDPCADRDFAIYQTNLEQKAQQNICE
jgi:hypothetical protein